MHRIQIFVAKLLANLTSSYMNMRAYVSSLSFMQKDLENYATPANNPFKAACEETLRISSQYLCAVGNAKDFPNSNNSAYDFFYTKRLQLHNQNVVSAGGAVGLVSGPSFITLICDVL